ncbi:IS5 family transposase [Brucella pituitosa]|uniref:IS5 family transposase n=1 Tax=Brucella pituitosa TaxID=571256 RepID=UPI001FFF6426|nr:IS5 family transposase [Brucella pituitosa]
MRCPSDLTDEEWTLVEPLIPAGKRGGGKRTVVLREVVNGLMYILSTGCQWRAVPKDLPSRSTLFGYFDLWNWDGTLARIHEELYLKCRGSHGPRSQSNCSGHRQPKRQRRGKRGRCVDPFGYDAEKKIKDKKRHILVDTVGLLLHALVHPADIQERDGGVLVLKTLFGVILF